MIKGAIVPVDQATLDSAGRAADLAVSAVLQAQGAVYDAEMRAEEEGIGGQVARLLQELLPMLQEANAATQRASMALQQLGADVPEAARPLDVPLHLMNTLATRRLLAALREAKYAAQLVDTERGWILDSGEGCGWVDTVGDIAERLRQEVEGPGGRE